MGSAASTQRGKQHVRPRLAAPVPPRTGRGLSVSTGSDSSGNVRLNISRRAYQAPTYQSPAYQSQTTYQSQPTYQAPRSRPLLSLKRSSRRITRPRHRSKATRAPAPAPLSADQLNSLVAPIALYPDALVAQVLAAAANPDQVAYADDWLAQNRNLTGQALAQAVDQQSWDPSVKALTQFPSVLDNLAHNLSWTSSLGQAFANQQSDVMAAVQAMRAKAQAAGTLQSNSQITVTTPSPSTIVIQPANPQVIYVPQYNPTVVYGAPVVVPYYVPQPLPVSWEWESTSELRSRLEPGSVAAVGVEALAGDGTHGDVHWGCCGGGGSTTIIYNHNTYINNHTWNNTNYNGYHPWGGGAAGSQNHAWYGNNGTFHPDGNYKPGEDTHYGPNGGYHPNGYFGPDGGWHADKNAGQNLPNGGNNGNHGLIGGNGGVQHASAPNGGANGNHGLIGGNGGVQHTRAHPRTTAARCSVKAAAKTTTPWAREQNRSRVSGDGAANRAESNRGRGSMAGRSSATAHGPDARTGAAPLFRRRRTPSVKRIQR